MSTKVKIDILLTWCCMESAEAPGFHRARQSTGVEYGIKKCVWRGIYDHCALQL